MVLLGEPIKWFIKSRENKIRRMTENPVEIQNDLLLRHLKKAKDTDYGKRYNFAGISNPDDFKNQCPLNDYESLKDIIGEMIGGKQNILWPTEIKWFSKSSGTTSDKSKFIPVSREALTDCHYKGGFDLLTAYILNNPDSRIFSGKTLVMGGSQTVHPLNNNSRYGDISAVMISNMPWIGNIIREPELSVALMDEWESKLLRMAETTLNKRITSIAGVPTWTLVLIQKLFELSGKDNLADVWPHLELYVHGGVSFTPYESTFKKLIRKQDMKYLQTYNASEGFFGFQDRNDAEDMLLATDHGIYYEFIPLEHVDEESPKTVLLDEVERGKNYALVISTNAGLWRYKIGDTVQFTSTNPYRIVVSGRTKHFINAFGEEVIVDNSDKAIAAACNSTGASVIDYTVAPVFLEAGKQGTHQWLVEFEKMPVDIQKFVAVLDKTLQSINSDYEAKRYRDIALRMPDLEIARKDLFREWLKSKGKLGGQHKIPRLSNDRKLMDELLAFNRRDQW